MPTTIAVLGDGAWGTAVAVLLSRSPEHQVRLWSAREEGGARLRNDRENVRYLPGVPIPKAVGLVTDPAAAVQDADLWVTAIPTVHLRPTLQRFKGLASPATPVVSLTKGIELATFRR